MNDYNLRFNGIGRLYGQKAWRLLSRVRVAVIGIGGVGSWTAEALVRTGIQHMTLIDLDEVCISNTNRQLHALEGNFGRFKVEAMADRMRAINPEARVVTITDFFTPKSAANLLAEDYDLIIDAIDSVDHKCLLIALCKAQNKALVSCGGVGGRRDPTLIRSSDLSATTSDSLLRRVRRKLRQHHDFPSEGLFGVPAVFSVETPVFPNAQGEVCEIKETGANVKLDCETGYGTASFVSGAVGFAAAAEGIKLMLARATYLST